MESIKIKGKDKDYTYTKKELDANIWSMFIIGSLIGFIIGLFVWG